MIYEFKSQATGTVVMTSDVAEMLLEVIGKEAGATGIITVEQMPEALDKLRNYRPPDPHAENATDDASQGDDDENEPPIPLRTRAVPLIEMIERALDAGKSITWGV